MRIFLLFLLSLLLFIRYSYAYQDSIDDGGSLRVDIAKIRLLKETEEINKAFVELDRLKAKYPKSTDILSTEADLFFHTKNYRKTLQTIDKALNLEPENQYIKNQSQNYRMAKQSYNLVSANTIHAGDSSVENIYKIANKTNIGDFTEVGFEVENNHFKINQVTRADGNIDRLSGDKQRAEIFLAHDDKDGDNYKISLYLGEDTLGVGVVINKIDNTGVTSVNIIFARPNWDFIEGLVNRGTKDVFSVARAQRVAPRFSVTHKLSINRYGIEKDYNVASSMGFNLDLDYSLPTYHFLQKYFGQNLYIGPKYSINGEYVLDKEEKLNPSASGFFPMAISSQEIHTFSFFAHKEFSGKSSLELYAGYSYDRLGDRGPSYGTSFIYKPKRSCELRINASRSISTKKGTSANNNLDQASIAFKMFF